jgi:dipeptidyl aminopeptidase/acylaminoacyl peptidase
LTNEDPAFESGEFPLQSSRVDAVVEMFGPTDLTLPMDWIQRQLLRRAFGTDDPRSTLLRQASPVNYVTGEAPPFLILQGEQDSVVPVEHARVLYQKLLDVRVDTTMRLVQNGNHNFKPTGGPIQPAREEISAIMGAFFDRILK